MDGRRDYRRLRRDVCRLHGPAAGLLLDDAYAVAERAHRGRHRLSGRPYIHHPVAVAHLVTSWQQPLALVCAGLLHDVPDELDDLAPARARLGDDVVELVEQVFAVNDRAEVAVSEMPRAALVVKLADRLHNARTWEFVPPAHARFKAGQTLSVYAPIADSLGLSVVAAELTTLSRAALSAAGPAVGADVPVHMTAAHVDRIPTLDGVSGRAFAGAVRVLPAHLRHRYHEEWLAELIATADRETRRRTALGLTYSALRLRAQTP